MANLISNAATTQLFTGAATFAAAEAGALAAVLNRFSTNAFGAAATATSVTFTATNLKVFDAVLLWVKVTAASPTGTFKVDLQKGGVSQAAVTVNKSDLPDSTNSIPVPVLFKLTTTATGDGGANWTIVITTTGTGTVTISLASATTTNYTRAIRTTTAATAAAGDNFFVMGELTGAGTHTSRTVTMDNQNTTAFGNGSVNSTTVYGGLGAVSCYGSLIWQNTASTNYILRLAGDLIVYWQGVYNQGAIGAEIPRNGSAILEFQPVSVDGDFGLRILENAVGKTAGLSRTSGKNVTQCKLTSDVSGASVITSPTATNGATVAAGGLDASGNSLTGIGFNDTVTNATHSIAYTGATISNTTQVATVWLARGSGTNNRYVRITVGNATVQTSVTNGFYSDLDLQAGTAGTVTAVGNGTATSVSITAIGAGYLIRMVGKCSSGSAIPRILLNACSAAATLSFAGAGNQCFVYDHMCLVTAASISDTTFNVDTDTGWLSGDTVVVAATTQNDTECEIYPLNANAGASSFTSALYPGGINGWNAITHHSTLPMTCEIGLLTRNVKVRSTSTTLAAYVYGAALATVDFSWTEFSRLGANVANKRGVEFDSGATANTKSVTYCSIHDADQYGVYLVGSSASINLTFSYNVIWNAASSGFALSSEISNGDWVIDSNLIMKLGGHGVVLSDFSGVVTNNVVVGQNSAVGYSYTNSLATNTVDIIGTFQNNTAHSNNGPGITISAASLRGTIDGFKAWRCASYSIFNTSACSADLYFTNMLCFGSASFYAGSDVTNISDSVMCGDTTYGTVYGFYVPNGTLSEFNLDNVDMTGDSTAYGSFLSPNTTAEWGFVFSNTLAKMKGVCNKCLFGAPLLFSGKLAWSADSSISFQNYNQVAGDHRTEFAYGTMQTDTVIFNDLSPSTKLSPTSATKKLESATKGRGQQVAVNSGDTVTPTVAIRKAANSDVGPNAFSTTDLTNITLSNGNLTATRGAGTGGVRSTTSRSGGKWYVEFTIGATVGNGYCGITRSTDSLVSVGTNGFLYTLSSGQLYYYGVNSVTISAAAAGDVIGLAIDLTNSLGWFRKNNGNWNNDALANPATGVGGISIASAFPTSPAFFYYAAPTASASATINLGATSFANAAPSGFSPWTDYYYGSQPRLKVRRNDAIGITADTVLATYSAGVGVWTDLVGSATVAATDNGVMEFVVDCDGTGFINVDEWDFA